VRLYLDASVLVSLFRLDSHTDRAATIVAEADTAAIVSDFARAEFASVMGRLARTGALTPEAIQVAFLNFDAWTSAVPQRANVLAIDMAECEALLRRLDLGLRAPDALHIAMAKRLSATLVTFDNHMAMSARALGLEVV